MKLDKYGGNADHPCPNGATGFFYLASDGGKTRLVTPAGNFFWLTSVCGAARSFVDSTVMASYTSAEAFWEERSKRLMSWGFNTLGEYTSTDGLPVATYGGKPCAVQQPFILLLGTLVSVQYHPANCGVAEPLKNITDNVPKTTYNGYQKMFSDVYDPNFATAVNHVVNNFNTAVFRKGFANIDWIVGITMDDCDPLWPLKSQAGAHPAWLIAVSPQINTKYIDQTVYSKMAWAQFLEKKYGPIHELNSAWGSNYKSWLSSGGYGVGTGLIDEDGRHHTWMGTYKSGKVQGLPPGVQADMDEFLYKFAFDYATTVVKAIRKIDQKHLIIAPNALKDAWPKVISGFKDAGADILCAHNGYSMTMFDGVPTLVWYGISANEDSEWEGYKSASVVNVSTQAERAAHYNADVKKFAESTNIIGIDWWAYGENNKSEHTNWGLVSMDNTPYDGSVASELSGTLYGDALTSITAANMSCHGSVKRKPIAA